MKCLASQKKMVKTEYEDGSSIFCCSYILNCPSTIKVTKEGQVSEHFMYFRHKDKLGIVYNHNQWFGGGLIIQKTSLMIDGHVIITTDFIESNVGSVEEKLTEYINRITNLLVFL